MKHCTSIRVLVIAIVVVAWASAVVPGAGGLPPETDFSTESAMLAIVVESESTVSPDVSATALAPTFDPLYNAAVSATGLQVELLSAAPIAEVRTRLLALDAEAFGLLLHAQRFQRHHDRVAWEKACHNADATLKTAATAARLRLMTEPSAGSRVLRHLEKYVEILWQDPASQNAGADADDAYDPEGDAEAEPDKKSETDVERSLKVVMSAMGP